MQRKNNNTILKIACATSMCIFSLFACFAGAIAWFTGIRVQDPKNTGMNGKNDDIHAEFTLYKYSTTNMMGTDKDDENNTLDITNFQLNTYDTIFTSKNKYTPALLKIKIYGTSLTETGSIVFTAKRDTQYDTAWIEKEGSEPHELNGYISSIIGMKCGFDDAIYETLIGSSSSSTPVDNIGDAIQVALASSKMSEEETFTTYTSVTPEATEEDENPKPINTFEKSEFIEISCSYTAADWIEGSDGVNFLNLFLVMDYSQELLKVVAPVSGKLDASNLQSTDSNFKNDIISFTVDHI